MADPDAPIRIARVGGRFLVFDVSDVARLRRQHGLCAVLFGITPQAPNQGSFGGLPLELAPDEVRWLVCDRRAAYVADDTADHLASLAGNAGSDADSARHRYLADNWRRSQEAVQAAADAEAADRLQRSMAARARKMGKSGRSGSSVNPTATTAVAKTHRVRVTPTTSVGLVGPLAGLSDSREVPLPGVSGDTAALSSYGLRAHLADRGFFATPGLRFGGDLSVYPGDPFRFHAHFVATSFGWDEPIVLLDLIGTGRLATGVKKGLLIGGRPPEEDDGGNSSAGDGVRTFTLEWAAI